MNEVLIMNDMTLGSIIAIKKNGKDGLKKFLAEYCYTKEEDYTDCILERILRQCLEEYIGTADNPAHVLTTYFGCKHDGPFGKTSDLDAIISTFNLQRVRNRNSDGVISYVNGFRDFEFNDWKLKSEETPRTTYEI